MSAPAGRVFTERDLDVAAAWLADGGVLAIPTETFYGLAADPRSPAAVDEVLRLKGRGPDRPLPLIAGDRPQVALVAPGWESSRTARRLADRFWPGPLTLVLDAGRGLAPGAVARDGTVAVRVCAHAVAAALARLAGVPLTATSANRAGATPPTDAEAARGGLPDSDRLAVLDAGPTPGGAPSTIVDARGGAPRVLREGAIGAGEIRRATAPGGP